MSVTLKVSSTTVRFGGVVALQDVELDVHEGELHSLIGPNGAGKSTLVAVICGNQRPAAGSVELDGRRLDGMSAPRRARAGLRATFQSPTLFSTLTIRQNLALARRARARLADPAPEHDGWLDRLPARYGLMQWLDTRAGDVPYPVQKVADLVRVLITRPRVLITDEPAAGLSHDQREQLAALMSEARATIGCSMVLIEHDVPLVFALADRITVLDNGKRIASGAPDDIRNHPEVLRAYLGMEVRS